MEWDARCLGKTAAGSKGVKKQEATRKKQKRVGFGWSSEWCE